MLRYLRISTTSLLLFAQFVFAFDPLCVKVYDRMNPLGFILGISDRVTFKMADGKDADMTFLGTMPEEGTSNTYFYFFDQKSGGVFKALDSRVRVETEVEYTPAKDRVQRMGRISCQGNAGSCAAHAPFNLMMSMKERDFLFPALRSKHIIPDDFAILKRLERSKVNAENRFAFPDGRDPFGRPLLRGQDFFGKDRLDEFGFKTVQTSDPKQLKAHLQKGLPALLFTVVDNDAAGRFPLDPAVDGADKIIPGFKADPYQRYMSGHEVSVEAYIPSKEHGDKILVKDSAFGTWYLWNFDDVVNSLRTPNPPGLPGFWWPLLPIRYRLRDGFILASPP